MPEDLNTDPTEEPNLKKLHVGMISMITDSTTLVPIPSVTTRKGDKIEVAVNEEEWRLSEPILQEMRHYGNLDETKLRAGMDKEMTAMKSFGVYEEVDPTTVDAETIRSAVTTRFEARGQGDELRCRLVAQDYWREIADRDETYASTPLLTTVTL